MYHILALAIGFVALVLNVTSYQLKNNRQLVMCRAAGDFVYVIHYLMLGAYSGCVTMIFCTANGLLCSFRGSAWADWKGWKWVVSVLLVASSVLTWNGFLQLVPNLCALISVLTTVWVTWSGKGNTIRKGRLFIAGPTWLLYSAIAGSIAGVLAEVIGMTSAATALWRYRKSKDGPPY